MSKIAIGSLDLRGEFGVKYLHNLLKPAFASFPVRFADAEDFFLRLSPARRIIVDIYRQIFKLRKVRWFDNDFRRIAVAFSNDKDSRTRLFLIPFGRDFAGSYADKSPWWPPTIAGS